MYMISTVVKLRYAVPVYWSLAYKAAHECLSEGTPRPRAPTQRLAEP